VWNRLKLNSVDLLCKLISCLVFTWMHWRVYTFEGMQKSSPIRYICMITVRVQSDLQLGHCKIWNYVICPICATYLPSYDGRQIFRFDRVRHCGYQFCREVLELSVFTILLFFFPLIHRITCSLPIQIVLNLLLKIILYN
jgi:hypothetical protein